MHACTHVTAPAPRTRAHEAAFGIVEMIVAMVIVAILMGVAIIAFGGSKATAAQKEAVAAAASYAQAVTQYRTDNGNKVPASFDQQGPRNLLDKPYANGVPTGVGEGRIGVTLNGATGACGNAPSTPPGAGEQRAWVSYCPTATAGTFAVRVLSRAGDSWTDDEATICWLGNSAKAPRC